MYKSSLQPATRRTTTTTTTISSEWDSSTTQLERLWRWNTYKSEDVDGTTHARMSTEEQLHVIVTILPIYRRHVFSTVAVSSRCRARIQWLLLQRTSTTVAGSTHVVVKRRARQRNWCRHARATPRASVADGTVCCVAFWLVGRHVKVSAASRHRPSFVSTAETCPSSPSPSAGRGGALPVSGSQIDAARASACSLSHARRQADRLDATHRVYVHHKHALHTHTCTHPAAPYAWNQCAGGRSKAAAAAAAALDWRGRVHLETRSLRRNDVTMTSSTCRKHPRASAHTSFCYHNIFPSYISIYVTVQTYQLHFSFALGHEYSTPCFISPGGGHPFVYWHNCHFCTDFNNICSKMLVWKCRNFAILRVTIYFLNILWKWWRNIDDPLFRRRSWCLLVFQHWGEQTSTSLILVSR